MARRRRMRIRGPAGLAVALVAAAAAWWAARQPPSGVPTHGVVAKIVDGDTLHVRADGVEHRLRLIGVDTPELHESDKLERDVQRSGQDKRTIQALGRRAADFTRRLCDGKSCRLEFDPANASQGYKDMYGRLLAYVYVSGEGGREVLLNAEIVRAGYGAAMTGYPMDEAKKSEFLRLQRDARSHKRGLWGEWKP